MKKIKTVYLIHLLILTFVFGLQSCASKKSSILVNKKVITKTYLSNLSNRNILYLIDGKEVSYDIVAKIKPNNIASINVIKSNEEVAKYTDKKYDRVLIIKMMR
jgi:ribosome biogenesis protein Nip4